MQKFLQILSFESCIGHKFLTMPLRKLVRKQIVMRDGGAVSELAGDTKQIQNFLLLFPMYQTQILRNFPNYENAKIVDLQVIFENLNV